jgi:hypothetical protein
VISRASPLVGKTNAAGPITRSADHYCGTRRRAARDPTK